MMTRTNPRPRRNVPRVPLSDDVGFFPSGGEAFGFRLPELAAMIPRRRRPIPRTRKLRFNGAEPDADDI